MGGRSSSSANQTSNVTNTDKRFANESGVAISSEGSSINLNLESVDKDIVGKALETVQVSDASNAEGFSKLLTLADKMTTKTQETAASMAGTYQNDVMKGIASGKTEDAGRLDQQTIVVLALAGVAGAVAIARKGK